MNTLRWFLLVCTALALVGFIALLTIADGFRRSFGASEHGPLLVILPLAVALVFLGALVWPEPKALRHIAAVMALILAGLSLRVFQESAFIGSLGLVYSGLWGGMVLADGLAGWERTSTVITG